MVVVVDNVVEVTVVDVVVDVGALGSVVELDCEGRAGIVVGGADVEVVAVVEVDDVVVFAAYVMS